MPRLNHNLSHSNANNNQQQTNLLTKIEENTKNINVNVGDVEINVQDVEALLATTNTTLASILIDTDAADSSLNTIEANSTLTASRLNNIQNKISANVDGTGDTLGQINSNILLKNTQIETLLTAANVDHAANEVLLTNAEAHLGNIDTGIDVLEACVGSNKVNVNISSGSISLPSGASTEAKQDVMETSLNAIQSAVEGTLTVGSHAVTNAGTFAVQAACSGTVTANLSATDNAVLDSIVSKNTQIETLLTAANVDHAANEALLITIDADTNDIKTSTAACATDLAALEVLSTAANVDLAAMEVLLTTIETTNTIKDVEWLSGATISDQSLSDVLDTEGYQNVFLYGENAGSISGSSLRVFGSNASAGTYYSVGTLAVQTSDSGRYLIREDSPLHDGPSPRYLKVFNSSGSTQTITKLRAVMSHKLRYV